MRKHSSVFLFVLISIVFSLQAESCRLLIVCHEAFTDNIVDFVKWKYETGWQPYVLEIDESTGSNSSSVKNAIINCIADLDGTPEYILIIGGDSIIRMGYLNSATTDAYYADIDSDNRTEIPIGRFPGTNVTQIRSLVYKTMHYAQDPAVDGDYTWLKNASLLNGGWDPHYTSFMSELSSTLGYYDYHVSLYTSSTTSMYEELNNGIGYIIFRGSGVDSWGGFHITPSDLSNGAKTPIVSGTTCATIRNYGPQWVNAGRETSPKGGVIYIGSNTVSSGHDLMMQRSAMAEGFYVGFLHGMTTGKSTELGRQYVLDYGGTACDREYSSLNMMGDPTIWVWTDIPHEISVEHYPFYITGDDEFAIQVTFEDEPVESALCCISIGDELNEWGYTDSTGYVELDYSYTSDGSDSMLVSVIGHNLMPYNEKVSCRVDRPRPYVMDSWVNDTVYGNSDGYLSRNELCNIETTVRNIGTVDCGEVIAVLSTDSPNITIIDSVIVLSSLATDTETTPEDCFQFQVNEGAIVGDIVEYNITLYTDSTEYVSDWHTPVVIGARIEYTDISLDDAEPWGNNDLILDFGENASMNIEIENIGDAVASDITLRVSCTTDELLFPYPRSYLRTLEIGSSSYMMPVPIVCNPNNVVNSMAEVVLEIQGIDSDFSTFSQTDTILINYRNANTVATGADAYGYFIYDNTDEYSQRNPEYIWTEISSIGARNRRLSSADNGVESITTPFSFTYYGLEYSEITISTEGYITAGNTYTCLSEPDNIPIPSYAFPTIAFAWDDLYPLITGDIYTYYDEENGKFIIQYKNITDSYGTRSTFEIAIFDTEIYPTPTGDNEIYFYYQDSLDVSNKTVGIQNQYGDIGLCYMNNGEYSPTAVDIIPGTALRVTTYPPSPIDIVNVYSVHNSISDIDGGDGDGRCEETEEIDISVTLENLGGLDAENVKVFLTSNDDRADIDIISDTIWIDELSSHSQITIPENLRFTFDHLDYELDAVFDIHVITTDGENEHIQPLYIPLREQLIIEDSQPNVFEIARAYPNPFNSTINFELPSDRSIIEIYSTDGKLIERHTPGTSTYKLDWHSSEYNTGIYLYRIVSEKDEISGKIVYIK